MQIKQSIDKLWQKVIIIYSQYAQIANEFKWTNRLGQFYFEIAYNIFYLRTACVSVTTLLQQRPLWARSEPEAEAADAEGGSRNDGGEGFSG